MSSASLAVVSRAHPDPVRIAALSATLALNLAAFVAALRPKAPALLPALVPPAATVVDWIESPPPAPLPPPLHVKPLPKPAPTPRVAPAPVTPPAVVPVDTGRVAAPPQPVAPPATATPAQPAVAPAEASLAYRSAPLRYPHAALQRHMQGTVLLRVLVDETGKPIDVQVARSSGYPLLDRSAREQVLAGWRFSPAMVDGHAVQAWARVPVSFALRQF
jgi:protein TonB